MRLIGKTVFVAVLMASLMVCSLPVFCIETTASDCERSICGEGSTYRDITEPLFFNDVDGPVSAEYINTLFGKHVCEYSNGFLIFVESIKLGYIGTAPNCSIFTFNDTGISQGITVKDGCSVNIHCDGEHLQNTSAGRYAAIRSDNNKTFVFNGTGSLGIYLESALYSTYVDCINVNGNISFNESKMVCNNGRGAGIVFYGDDIHFNSCNVEITADSYGIYCKNGSTNHLTFDQCNVTVTSTVRAFLLSGSTNITTFMCSMYGAYNLDMSDEMPIDDIGFQKYICIEHDLPFFVDSSIFFIIFGVVLVSVVAIIIIAKIKGRTNRTISSSSADDKRNDGGLIINYEPTLPSNNDSVVKEAPRYGSKEAPVYVPREDPPVQHSSSKNNVEITLSSELNDMSSFTFTLDGRVYGYIGYNRSTIDVPSGMHEVIISINDMNKKVILKENILLNRPMEFCVVKKFKGYAVVRR